MKDNCAARGSQEESEMPLHRSRRNSIIAGVCGGIAEWLGWSPTWVRILYVVGSIVSVAFPGLIVYIILWIVVPKSPS
jgi:phage shock protein C